MTKTVPTVTIFACFVLIFIIHFFVQGSSQLGIKPPVYHDEFVVTEGSRGVLKEGIPTAYFHNSRPPLEEILEGKGRFNITINAGFHYLFAGWTAVFGKSAFAARLFPSLSSLLVALILWRLGRLLFQSSWAGFFAALWWILDSSVTQAARQLRPDIPTALAYLSACWILWEWAGSRKWASWAAGFFAGLGMTMHPVGLVLLPGVFASFFCSGAFDRFGWRSCARLLFGCSVFLVPYAIYLLSHWDAVTAMLQVNAVQRQIPKLGYLNHLITAFKGAYPNSYQVHVGWIHALLFAASLLAMFFLSRKSRSARCVFVSALLAILLLPFLGRDYFNFLYLAYLWPWLFLAGGGFLVLTLRFLEGPFRFRKWVSSAALVLVLIYGILFSKTYLAEALELGKFQPAGYDSIIRPLVALVPEGSIVIGTPNAFPIVEAKDGIFLHNKMYVQWFPAYQRYPVSVNRAGSHCLSYAFNREVLEALSKTGRPLYFHLDMYDWAWNTYFPFGSKYGRSYLDLEKGLEQNFRLEAVSYSHDRGRVELWRYAEKAGSAPSAPQVYVEGKPVTFHEPVTAVGTTQAGYSFPTEPGAWYWLEMKIRVEEGGAFTVLLNGKTYHRYFDAACAVPLDYVFRAEEPILKIEFLNLMNQGKVTVDSAKLRKVEFKTLS